MSKSVKEIDGVARQGQRFATLDGLRGFAAICVALYHFSKTIMPAGYLAVDFFFMLSGFVLFQTYQKRFDSGLSFAEFARIRFTRLFPLHFLGVLIGALYVMQRFIRGSEFHLSFAGFVASFFFNAVMLPTPIGHSLFPLNDPAWSLFCEIMANFAMALWLIRLDLRGLLIVAITGGVLLVAAIWFGPPIDGTQLTVDGGVNWASSHIGVLRTMFSFTFGMALAHLPVSAMRRSSVLALFYGLLLVGLLAFHPPESLRLAYDLAFVFVASPMLVYLGSRIEPDIWFRPVALFIGEMSFALYAVHASINHAFSYFAVHMHVSEWIVAPFFIIATMALAWCAIRWFEPFMKQILSKVLPKRT